MCAEVTEAVRANIVSRQVENAVGGLGRVYFEEGEGWWKQGGADEDDLWMKASWRHGIALGGRKGDMLRRVWLTGPDYDMLKGNVDALKRTWAKRMRKVVLQLDTPAEPTGRAGKKSKKKSILGAATFGAL